MYDNKNKIIGILILAAVIFSLFTIYVYSSDTPATSARAAALYEPETKSFLYLKNASERLPMASTTKIMTAILALELLDADEIIEASTDTVGIEGSSIYLEAGEALSVIDLVYALILQSANDAAATLAKRISGSSEAFAVLMTNKARELGALDTQFQNPHGLDAVGHYTTARDLAIISAYALQNPTFSKITSTYKHEIESSSKTRLLVNHNKMLKSYDGAIGVKTGYTKKSGRSLVSAAVRDGLTMIAVTINAPDDWRDHKELLDYGFKALKKHSILENDGYSCELPVINGDKDSVTVKNEKEFKLISPPDRNEYSMSVKLSRYLVAPISKGEQVGEIIITENGTVIGRIPLVATENIKQREKQGFFSKFEK